MWKNVSDRVVAGVAPGGTIKTFPDGVNVRALERAGFIRPWSPPKKKRTKKVTNGDSSS